MFPELDHSENAEIQSARAAGYAEYFPAFPSAEAQARNTLAGARAFWDNFMAETMGKPANG